METVKVREASEKQINYIKRLCLQTQTRLTIENEELDNIDFKSARFLIKALRTHRVHPLIEPCCQAIHKVNISVMKQSSSELKPVTPIQEAILKNFYSKGQITPEEFNSKNSKEACKVIEKHLKGEEEMNTSEIVSSQTKIGKGVHFDEQQKLEIKKLYLEEKLGVPSISKKLNIPVHKIYYYLHSQSLTRSLSDYLSSPEAHTNRTKMHKILMEKAQRGELKRKPKKITLQNALNAVEDGSEDICLMIGQLEIKGKSSHIAKLLKSLNKEEK